MTLHRWSLLPGDLRLAVGLLG